MFYDSVRKSKYVNYCNNNKFLILFFRIIAVEGVTTTETTVRIVEVAKEIEAARAIEAVKVIVKAVIVIREEIKTTIKTEDIIKSESFFLPRIVILFYQLYF